MSLSPWRPSSHELTDEMWDLIRDLFEFPERRGPRIGRPRKWTYRQIVEAVLYVTVTGCQWRQLPAQYPHWNTVHRYHLGWSRDGTWEKAATRLARLERTRQGRAPDPTGAVIDARTVKGASTVCGLTRGYDAGKKIVGRKLFGVVDTIGLLICVVVVAANVSDNVGGILAMNRAATKSRGLAKLWADAGFKTVFKSDIALNHNITTETVEVKDLHTFKVQPRRWVVERTFGWLVNSRRLRIDYERDPITTEGFVWAAHTLMLLRRLTTTPNP